LSEQKSRETGKDSIIAISISIFLVVSGFWTAFQFVGPPSPSRIIISSGSEQAAYFDLAYQYQQILADNGIHQDTIQSYSL
jgi:hypothetical protein